MYTPNQDIRDLNPSITDQVVITQGATGKELLYLQQAAILLADKLNVFNQSVTISFNPPVCLDDSQHGVTIGLGEKLNKIFVMITNNLTIGEKLLTLAHEMVHVSQLFSRKLVFNKLEGGQICGEWDGEMFDNIKYSRRNPWEIEAHTDDKNLKDYVLNELGNFIA